MEGQQQGQTHWNSKRPIGLAPGKQQFTKPLSWPEERFAAAARTRPGWFGRCARTSHAVSRFGQHLGDHEADIQGSLGGIAAVVVDHALERGQML